ncbi:alpha/beta fold hydrolase [Gordonia sp. DT30]|uniref:alpha/beta fold hydrolase n=1 Tax=Gordonia sp. DT30 TaxID=3416546 RepID=UPI003CF6A883
MTAPHPGVVLLHGAWAQSWVWDLVVERLADAGITCHRPDLLGAGHWGDDPITLTDVVDAVIDEIADIPGDLVVIGHSGGGVVATDVAERLTRGRDPRIRGLGYVAGMMLPSGMNFGQLCTHAGLAAPVGISAFTEPTADGRGTVVPPEAGAAVFFQQADAHAAVSAARRLVPQLESTRLIAPEWTAEGAGSLPRLYVEATLDRSVPLAAQREMQRLSPGARVVTLETDHAPQLSRPDELAAILAEFVHSMEHGHSDVTPSGHPSRTTVRSS